MAARAAEKLSLLRKQLAAATLKPLSPRHTFRGTFDLPVLDLKQIPPITAESTAEIVAMTAALQKQATPADSAAKPSKLIVPPPDVFEDSVQTARKVWEDRLKNQRREAASEDDSLGAFVASYLVERRALADAGNLSVGRAYAIELHLRHFQDWFGKITAAAELDAKTLADYRIELLKAVTAKNWSRTTAGHYMTTVKSFVRWLWQIEAIQTLPRNLDGKSASLRIGRESPEVVVFEIDEIKTLLERASDRTKLYILLMLNCGMTQKDISDLKQSEVDWGEGRITRKRSKTKGFENVPTVTYPLWRETFRLLQQEQADGDDVVLRNENGGSLWSEEMKEGGKYCKNDNIKNAFNRLCKATGISKPLKSLKKTSATLIRNNAKFASLESLFLGHAPQNMADRHYTQIPQGLLNDAIAWLGGQYGMATRDDAL